MHACWGCWKVSDEPLSKFGLCSPCLGLRGQLWATKVRDEIQNRPQRIPARSKRRSTKGCLHIVTAGKLTKRSRMHRADPHCFWCGRETVLTGHINAPNLATIDHLYSRLHPQRRAPRGHDRDVVLHVLACWTCNQARSHAEQRGKMFQPKLPERCEIAIKCSASNTSWIPPGEVVE